MEKINFECAELRGVIRKVDDLGRVSLPASFRREIGLQNGQTVEILLTVKNEIVIKKYGRNSGAI